MLGNSDTTLNDNTYHLIYIPVIMSTNKIGMEDNNNYSYIVCNVLHVYHIKVINS